MSGAASAVAARREPGFWNRLVWALVFPRRRQRVVPTVSGVLLVLLSFGLGSAAYNAANNILFITLSLLLACLVLSGVLSWLNFRGVDWRLEVVGPWRAGQVETVGLRLTSSKRILPTYGLWFQMLARSVRDEPPAKAETTFTARGIDVRAALEAADAAELRATVPLETRLDPRGEVRLEWALQPPRRGRLSVELDGVGSLFPFGFLRKEFAADLAAEVVVWPAPVVYRRLGAAAIWRAFGRERVARAGTGSDLLALRRYAPGDSHRLVHWKASARAGRLLVRQFAAEGVEGQALWVQTHAAQWSRPEQFELMLGFAASLAEDLFRTGSLTGLALDDEPLRPVRRVHDLEAWLDRLAVVKPAAGGERQAARGQGRNETITFSPDGAHGVAAWLDGEKLAVA